MRRSLKKEAKSPNLYENITSDDTDFDERTKSYEADFNERTYDPEVFFATVFRDLSQTLIRELWKLNQPSQTLRSEPWILDHPCI